MGPITSITKIEFDDCKGITTCSEDGRSLNLSLSLDIWGVIGKLEESHDPLWKFPSNEKSNLLSQELDQMNSVLKKINLRLDGPRMKL